MRALKHPDVADASLVGLGSDIRTQFICHVLSEVDQNLRNMCFAMSAARHNAFRDDDDIEKVLSLLETFYTFVDDQADALTALSRELPLITVAELEELKLAAPGMRRVRPMTDIIKAFGETVAPENAA